MNNEQSINVEIKNVYGNDLIYPINEVGMKFACLLKKKTLTKDELKIIKELGFTIEVISKGLDI
jgi:hypothetical protein